MFKDLRTSTKLLVLCGTFMASVLVPVYALVAEKQLAIDIARKELSGSRYLATIRTTYAAVLALDRSPASDGAIERELAAAETRSAGQFQTSGLSQALAATVRELGGARATSAGSNPRLAQVLAKAQALASRIGDDSSLALDPDLDSYYVQNIVVRKLPTFLGELAQLQDFFESSLAADAPFNLIAVRLPTHASLVRSTADEVRENVEAAYRGNPDGRLKQAMEGPITRLISSMNSYLGALSASAAGVDARDGISLNRFHAAVLGEAKKAWEVAHAELDRLLQQRVDNLTRRMHLGLALIGIVAGLSIFIGMLTHRHIVGPLQRLEAVALEVREAKDYNLRVEHQSHDEIGRVTAAFNDMLAELATARKRERAQQAELARATRLTTMGEMAASIAHEVNQPLAAIVTNGNAGLRWLTHATPDLSRVQGILQRIVKDGLRAHEVVASVRAMFKRDVQQRSALQVDRLIDEVLRLLQEDLHGARISLDVALNDNIPEVAADRVQLQQVMLNLITNAIDAISTAPSDQPRWLRVKAEATEPHGVLVAIEDSGPGITTKDMERVFEPFFTTKAGGMGLGLSICRSIVEAHDGRLWVSPGNPHGTVFMFTLPAHDPGEP